METTRNPFAGLLAFIIGMLFILGLAYGAYIAVQRGMLLPRQTIVNGQQQPRVSAPALAPRVSVPGAVQQPQAPAAPAEKAPAAPQPAQPIQQQEYQAPGAAAPAGAPMTEEYKTTIQEQNRTNANGEVCLPRSGCTKPGSGGALPWPNGRP